MPEIHTLKNNSFDRFVFRGYNPSDNYESRNNISVINLVAGECNQTDHRYQLCRDEVSEDAIQTSFDDRLEHLQSLIFSQTWVYNYYSLLDDF